MCHFRHFPEKLIEAGWSVFQIKQDEDSPFTRDQALGGCIGKKIPGIFNNTISFFLIYKINVDRYS